MHFLSQRMLLVYIPKLTNRLGYTLKVVLGSILRINYEITTDKDFFLSYEGAKLCYGTERTDEKAVWIKSQKLLFQYSIEDQEIGCIDYENTKAIFPVFGKDLDFPFDLLAATFYQISRYEEYLPNRRDEHGRFMATESIAYKHHFLHQPVVEIWAKHLGDRLRERFPDLNIPTRKFEITSTVDIDAAYRYRHKGIMRTMIGFGKDILREKNPLAAKARWRSIIHKEEDPYDTFEYMLEQQKQHPRHQMAYFVLLADYGIFDKNISYLNHEFRELLKHLADHAKVGIHTSYASFEDPQLIETEASRLHDILNHNIVRNRCHFLRLQLPSTYRSLLQYGIKHDYTMGYADEPGYRAGTSTAFYFYDLGSDSETELLVHPFAIIDSALQRHKGYSPAQAKEVYKSMIDELAEVGGTFQCVWHNESFSERFGWEGWRKLFEWVQQYCEKRETNR